MASVAAWVMPDGRTTYRQAQYSSNGLFMQIIDKWVNANTNCFRTNLYGYAANGVDLIVVTNALGIQVVSNLFNNNHEVTTNYDALNEITISTYDPTTLLLTNISHPSGLSNVYTYNSSHRLITRSPTSRLAGPKVIQLEFGWHG